jgi:hypothetical protein
MPNVMIKIQKIGKKMNKQVKIDELLNDSFEWMTWRLKKHILKAIERNSD